MERHRQSVWASLMADVAGGAMVLDQVATRLGSPHQTAIVRRAAWSLRSLRGELRGLAPDASARNGGDEEWVLDRGWHPAVFDVASDRPRVLLTIGANALHTVCQHYDTVLDEEWADDIETALLDQRRRIEDFELLVVRARQDLVPRARRRDPAVS